MTLTKEKELESPGLITIANILTASRLVLLPVIIYAIAKNYGYLAAGTMAAVLVTDLLDGRIARRLGQASTFGGTLDSTIDFVLIYSLFIAFFAAGHIQTYQFALLYVAMLTNLLAQIVNMGGGKAEGVVRTKSGKVTGALQYFYLLFLVAREALPKTQAVMTADFILFALLGVSIVVSSLVFIMKLKQMSADI